MNRFLNATVQESHANKGRNAIQYQHIKEIDSFRLLNETGISILPPVAQRRRGDRQLSMRTSTDTNTGEVKAQIVKVKLGEDLHIFGATDPYDIRISMNLEIDLNKPGFDPELMSMDSVGETQKPNRKKDRLSYKHLAYSIDLTRVDRIDANGKPSLDKHGFAEPVKYELELELDSKMVVGQYKALKQQQPNAYLNMVDGFVENMMYLVKQNRQD